MSSDSPSVTNSDYFLRAIAHLRLLPANLRFRLVNLCRNTDRTPDRRFTVSFFGLKYSGSLACEIDSKVFFFGAYEPGVLAFFRKVLETMDSPVVADVGANVGHHSLFLSQLAAQVHSFEPWPKVRAQLLQRLRDNDIRNVTVHGLALGSQDETKLYYAPEGGNSGTGSFLSTHATDRNRPSEQLRIVNGDDYFQKSGIDKLDLLKIDVEGWEWFVLLGLTRTIQRCRPVVLFETSKSTLQVLRTRSQLNIFHEYKVFLFGKHIRPVVEEEIPLGNLLMIPAEKMELLRK